MEPREVIEVTTGVWVVTSRLYQTTSTIVARDGKALLIDPAWTPDELEGLAATGVVGAPISGYGCPGLSRLAQGVAIQASRDVDVIAQAARERMRTHREPSRESTPGPSLQR